MIKKNVKYPRFSKVDFIRLYCAMNFKNGCSPIIKHHELEKKLYSFYPLPEFRELFQDICPKKDHINPENNYLDLENALQTAQLFGLLTLIYGPGEIRSIVSCDEDTAQKIISSVDAEMVDKMNSLFNAMFGLDNNLKEKDDTQISSTKSVLNNFIEELDSSNLTCDKEQPTGTKLVLDEETQGPKLVKKVGRKNN